MSLEHSPSLPPAESKPCAGLFTMDFSPVARLPRSQDCREEVRSSLCERSPHELLEMIERMPANRTELARVVSCLGHRRLLRELRRMPSVRRARIVERLARADSRTCDAIVFAQDGLLVESVLARPDSDRAQFIALLARNNRRRREVLAKRFATVVEELLAEEEELERLLGPRKGRLSLRAAWGLAPRPVRPAG